MTRRTTRTWANALGWFSIGLGLTELVAAKPIARALGFRNATLFRAYGVREVLAGIGLLTQRKKGPWIWARIAGDALDVATLGKALFNPHPLNPKRGNAALALAAVSPVVIADIACGRELGVSA
jgi:hypothetical protein